MFDWLVQINVISKQLGAGTGEQILDVPNKSPQKHKMKKVYGFIFSQIQEQ